MSVDAYSPFDKPLQHLEAADLAILQTTHEGWYVEYKAEIASASSIAKSISAFSNTYGGWLFYGIQEKSKDETIAGQFPGIARSDVDVANQRIRQAAASHIAPSPYFNIKIIWGPCEEIGLQQHRAIICVEIPYSQFTPHVHKSGQIYRRVSDGSEPRPENDRFILDELWQRSNKIRKMYARWLKNDPTLTNSEKKTPYLRLLIVPDPWLRQRPFLNVTVDDVREIMQRSEKAGIEIPFETVYTTATGFLARQVHGNSPHNLGLTWHLRRDLSSEILLPFHKFEVLDLCKLPFELMGYKHAERFTDILRTQRFDHANILDLNFLFNLMVGVVRIQQRLCEKANWSGPWFSKVRLLNVWRTSPFIDMEEVLDVFAAQGVPVSIPKKITFPPGSDPETFLEVPLFETIENGEGRLWAKAAFLFTWVAMALGVPESLSGEGKGEDWFFHGELYRAGERATEAQKVRGKRRSL